MLVPVIYPVITCTNSSSFTCVFLSLDINNTKKNPQPQSLGHVTKKPECAIICPEDASMGENILAMTKC